MFLKLKNIVFLIIILSFCFPAIAQNNDTIKIKHSPRKAALMSTFMPGLGQIYNRKYWKAPIVYAGLGTLTYFLINNNRLYNKYKTAYQYRMDGDPTTIDNLDFYSPDQLKINRDIYRSNLELTVVLTAGLYLINIVDASVDANLYKFDVSEDISLNVNPILIKTQPYSFHQSPGLCLTLNF